MMPLRPSCTTLSANSLSNAFVENVCVSLLLYPVWCGYRSNHDPLRYFETESTEQIELFCGMFGESCLDQSHQLETHSRCRVIRFSSKSDATKSCATLRTQAIS